MFGERDYQRTVEDGRRNQEVKVLIQNWCGHARIEKFGGTGLIEAQTGFPIGHHSMACDHAPMGGSATWHLEHAALEFYDRNCETCTVRQPLRLPNLLELVRRRDQEVADLAARGESEAQRLREAYETRQQKRETLKINASAPVIAFLDDLQQLDQTGDNNVAERITETARLAPEVFNRNIVEHLFELIETGESWAIQVALVCVRVISPNHNRLAACAMRCLADGEAVPTAAEMAYEFVDVVEVSSVEGSVRSLCFLAAPPRDMYNFAEPEQHPQTLQVFALKFPSAVEKALDKLLSSASATSVKAVARALPLIYQNTAYPPALLRGLAAKLTRVDSLINIDRDSEVDDVVHELKRALVHAMLVDHQHVDSLLTSYYAGASIDGEARIASIYSSVLRMPISRSDSVTPIADEKPFATALRRVLSLASSTKNPEVIDEVREALQHFPEQLAAVATEEMEFLLGAAILVDQALTTFEDSPALPETPGSFFAQLDKDNHRQRLYSLRAAILEWSSHAAASDVRAANKFISFASSNAHWQDSFRSAFIQALPPLMVTAASTNAALPFLYGAMVSESIRARVAAARAIGEMRGSRVRDMPSLMHDAFLLLLSDPIIVVHQSAVRALERISLPEEYDERIERIVEGWFFAYREDRERHEFLVTCADLLMNRKQAKDNDDMARIIVAILMRVDEMILLRHGRAWFLRRLVGVDGFPGLLLKLIICSKRGEHHDEDIVALLRGLKRNGLLSLKEGLIAQCKAKPDDRMLIAVLIEVLSAAGAWDAAAEIGKLYLHSIPDSTRMLTHKRIAQMTLLATQFEQFLSGKRNAEALACAAQWREVRDQFERDGSAQ